ncbi:MAG: hypothetical protein ABIH03_07150 [Pseudomonadota bacterium]
MGKPSERSKEWFFLASYDIDGFRSFVSSLGFTELFELDPAEKQALTVNDEALLRFAFRFLRQALFGEISVPVRANVAEYRRERHRRRVGQMERGVAARKALGQDKQYESLNDE